MAGLGQAVRPTNSTDIITLAFGIATGCLVGLITVPIAGIPVGLGAMGGVVVAGMAVSIARAINPALGGPMPEGARAFLESIGVDLFVCGLGLNVAPEPPPVLERLPCARHRLREERLQTDNHVVKTASNRRETAVNLDSCSLR